MARSKARKDSVQAKRGGLERRGLAQAANYAVEAMEQRVMLSGGFQVLKPTWREQGPAPITNGLSVAIPLQNNPAGGAVEAIATPPNDANLVFLGTVNGGVWQSTNAAGGNPTWTALTDNLGSLSIGAVALGRFDIDGKRITSATPVAKTPLNKTVVYAGIGKYSSARRLGGNLTGLYKSTNGGGSWFPLDGQLVLQR